MIFNIFPNFGTVNAWQLKLDDEVFVSEMHLLVQIFYHDVLLQIIQYYDILESYSM